MMYTRDARNDDEAWMLEKLSQEEREEKSFRSRDFLVAVDEESGQRVAFGRMQYHRDVDETEYVEFTKVVILDRAEDEHGCLLLQDLAQQAQKTDQNQVFTFPHANHDVFEEVGFERVDADSLPEVMMERYEDNRERLGDDTVAMVAQPRDVEYEIPEEDPHEKPSEEEITEEEIEEIKDDLDIEDATTKYSV